MSNWLLMCGMGWRRVRWLLVLLHRWMAICLTFIIGLLFMPILAMSIMTVCHDETKQRGEKEIKMSTRPKPGSRREKAEEILGCTTHGAEPIQEGVQSLRMQKRGRGSDQNPEKCFSRRQVCCSGKGRTQYTGGATESEVRHWTMMRSGGG